MKERILNMDNRFKKLFYTIHYKNNILKIGVIKLSGVFIFKTTVVNKLFQSIF